MQFGTLTLLGLHGLAALLLASAAEAGGPVYDAPTAVEAGGTIRWVCSNPDYTVRPDNASLLEAAQKFAAPSSD